MREMRSIYKILVGKLEGKRPLQRLGRLKQRGYEVVDWVQVKLDRVQWRALVNMIIDFRVHKMLGIS
jgi:hypothetical protein